MDAASLAFLVGFSNRALNLNLAGLTHADALVQPSGGGNCVNWLLGHLLVHRNRMLEALGEPPSWTSPAAARYDRGSAPITGEGEGVVRTETLREELDRAHERVMEAIQRAGDEKLAEPSPAARGAWGSTWAFYRYTRCTTPARSASCGASSARRGRSGRVARGAPGAGQGGGGWGG